MYTINEKLVKLKWSLVESAEVFMNKLNEIRDQFKSVDDKTKDEQFIIKLIDQMPSELSLLKEQLRTQMFLGDELKYNDLIKLIIQMYNQHVIDKASTSNVSLFVGYTGCRKCGALDHLIRNCPQINRFNIVNHGNYIGKFRGGYRGRGNYSSNRNRYSSNNNRNQSRQNSQSNNQHENQANSDQSNENQSEQINNRNNQQNEDQNNRSSYNRKRNYYNNNNNNRRFNNNNRNVQNQTEEIIEAQLCITSNKNYFDQDVFYLDSTRFKIIIKFI